MRSSAECVSGRLQLLQLLEWECTGQVSTAANQSAVDCDLLALWWRAGATALMLKRGWAEDAPEERNAFFQDVEGAVATSGHPAARCAGIEILEVRVASQAVRVCWPQKLLVCARLCACKDWCCNTVATASQPGCAQALES